MTHSDDAFNTGREEKLAVNLQVLVSNTIWRETIRVAGMEFRRRRRRQTGRAAEKSKGQMQTGSNLLLG